MQGEPVHLRHLQVGNDAARRVRAALGKKFPSRPKRLHRKAARPQHSGRGGQIRGVVVHEEDSRGHAAPPSATGSVKRNVAPPSALFSAQSLPP